MSGANSRLVEPPHQREAEQDADDGRGQHPADVDPLGVLPEGADRDDVGREQHRQDDAGGRARPEDEREHDDMHQAHAWESGLRDAHGERAGEGQQPLCRVNDGIDDGSRRTRPQEAMRSNLGLRCPSTDRRVGQRRQAVHAAMIPADAHGGRRPAWCQFTRAKISSQEKCRCEASARLPANVASDTAQMVICGRRAGASRGRSHRGLARAADTPAAWGRRSSRRSRAARPRAADRRAALRSIACVRLRSGAAD